jgi:hypothetical protein
MGFSENIAVSDPEKKAEQQSKMKSNIKELTSVAMSLDYSG